MKKNFLFSLIISALPVFTNAQQVMGHVYEINQGKEVPLPDVNVVFPGTTVGTTSGRDGMFMLDKPDSAAKWIVFSYAGYKNDTVIAEGMNIKVVMQKVIELREVEVEAGGPDTYISSLSTLKTEVITSDELENNACCNLSESFEANPTVDVSFSDAITGAKQIQMLGLAGKYSQILTDVLPTVRGLGITYGLNFIPGPWIESINLNKGAGSVANGYESITGQIDVELKKPEKSEPLFLNLYGNSEQRFEMNGYSAQKISEKWNHMILFHGNTLNNKMDHNHDHFLDHPLNKSVILMDRWKFDSKERVEAMFGVKLLYDDRWGGETHFNPEKHKLGGTYYGFGLMTTRGEAFFKSSLGFPEKKFQSIGIQLSGISHNVNGYFGLKEYSGTENSLYANLILLSIIKNSKHKFKTGLTYLYDKYAENFDTVDLKRTESVPGGYFEYTFDDLDKWSLVAGVREDYHNLHGFVFTPRVHARYKPTPISTLRASAGSGFRVADILAENSAYMATSRQFVIKEELKAEKAWNYGVNFTQKFYTGNREGTFSIDLYRTDFVNQVIVDADTDPTKIFFYNLDGKSYSNSLQAEISYQVFKGFNVRFAYKFYDVKATFNDTLLESPLTPKHRALAVLTYETPDKHWNFSFTAQWVGEQRLQDTRTNPAEDQMPSKSPSYFRLLGQVSYSIGKWELYAGGENLNNFVQEDRIIGADDPFGPHFDSSIIWGPLTGRMVYGGVRFTIK